MRGFVYFAALTAASALPGAAIAQERSGVDDYLCTFAGKCGDAAGAQEVKAAPATKGFSLARPKQETTAAPDTKGFSLARPRQDSTAAPDTRGFALRRADSAKPAARPAAVRAAPTRGRPVRAAAAAATPTLGSKGISTGARADLMLSFELNSAQMTGPARERAKVFAQALNTAELKGHRFMIEGHTDSVGGRAANRDLSQRRAQSVADFLVGQGVDRSRLEVEGLGFDRPLPGKSIRAEENRRVEAALIS